MGFLKQSVIFKFFAGISIAMAFPYSAFGIINGTDVSSSDDLSKHIVALRMEEKQADGSLRFYKGTGVLITDRIILTAGHNFFYLPKTDNGSAIFSVQPDWQSVTSGQIETRIERVEVHPGFKQTNMGTENDLALVFLKDSAPKNYLPLAIADFKSPVPSFGNLATVVGFGKDVEFDQSAPLSAFRLRKTTIPFTKLSGADFQNSQKLWFNQSITGFCGGDSGAPALFYEAGQLTIYGIAIHTGINSQGKMMCLTEGAFTNISYFRRWISETVESLEKSRRK